MDYSDKLRQEKHKRKRAGEALRESEKRFRIIFDGATDGILLADSEKRTFILGNKAICGMLGYSLEELKELSVMDIHPKEDLPYVLAQFEKQARREIKLAKDLPVKRKDGSVFYADINTAPIKMSGKICLMGIFRDITERKQAEEERKKLISDLQAALAEIKTLSGIIPICAKCKKIRDDKGYWKQVEVYIQDHTEAEFSHGLCPECAAKMEKEIDQME